jgi:hypothetical protein
MTSAFRGASLGSASHTPTSISNSRIVFRHSFAISRRDAPEPCMHSSPHKTEGVGNAGCPPHPQPRVQSEGSTRVSSPQVHRNHPAFPHAMVLTAYFVLSPVIGLSCHRRWRIGHACARSGRLCLRELDAGVEASGPHDFAVRSKHLSSARPVIAHRPIEPALPSRRALRRCRVHRIPPRVRDDRDTPLLGDETARDIEVIWVRRERKYFCKRGWTAELPNSPSRLGKYSIVARCRRK